MDQMQLTWLPCVTKTEVDLALGMKSMTCSIKWEHQKAPNNKLKPCSIWLTPMEAEMSLLLNSKPLLTATLAQEDQEDHHPP